MEGFLSTTEASCFCRVASAEKGSRLSEMSLLLLVLACATWTVGALEESGPPHIVFILADDLGWADVSMHGSPQIPTPNIDALACTGMALNNYYVQPLCSPSRAALLSGLYAIHTGFQESAILPGVPAALSLNVKIMPEYLKDLGYETHMLGKWHIGYQSLNYTPTFRGFDSFCGIHTGPDDYYSHILEWEGHRGLDFWNDTQPLTAEDGKYSTTLFTERAASIISNRDKSKPLFLYLAHQASHSGINPNPLQAPEENVAKFPYIGQPDRTTYAGMVDALDQSVGAVLEALEAESMLRNTIIVFSSDNGGSPTGFVSNFGFNWPLRGAKQTVWEGGIRASAFIWSPQLRHGGKVSQQLMHITDWLPTLYAAAGFLFKSDHTGGDVKRLGALDGIDTWHSLVVGKPSPRSEILHNIDQNAGIAALRYRDFKLVVGSDGEMDARFEVPGGSRPYGDLDALLKQSKAAAVLRRFYGKKDVFKHVDRWRLQATIKCGHVHDANFRMGGSYYLFDIVDDPCEQRNLAKERPDVLSMMLEKLAIYNETVVPPVTTLEDPRSYPDQHNGIWAPWL
ncbi:arylsulfatase B-like isoform X1 [Dermacentor andersoni]|uniref:arylsulfatase B-like isoform X1 n=1 Tax=Dermacentor andersoni TaxID=34620 RepID=UPI00241761DA|nr:arylsulfatase B-like isoform X1 [Dermacentor andersoni]